MAAIRMLSESPARRAALEVAEALRAAGHRVYFVGGCVRDTLLQTAVKDVDVATSARPDAVMSLFAGEAVPIGAAFGIVNVVRGGVPVEVATFRLERGYGDGRHPEEVVYADGPEPDAARRDFTVNALFLDPWSGEVLDFVGGMGDIRLGVLRCVGDPRVRLEEDRLRVLRMVRFAFRLGFRLDPGAEAAAAAMAPLTRTLSAERVRDELTKTLTGPRRGAALKALSRLGLLAVHLPEVEAMRGVPQPPKYHPEGDVFEHTALMLDCLAWPDAETAWAALLHDVGKPATFFRDANGVERFHCHAERGAEMAEGILRRLRLPNALVERVCKAVKDHMRFGAAPDMRNATLRRLLAEPTFPLELELHRADCAASSGDTAIFTFLLDKVAALAGEVRLPPPLLRGADLLARGMRPGPALGEILREAANHQFEGRLRTRGEALAWLASRLAADPP